MNDTERVDEIVEMLMCIIEQIRPMGKHCKIDNIEANSVDWVLRSAAERLEYLNKIRWDEIQ